MKGWNYLRHTALQKDGSVGYVQPIGEKAIPGQVVDKKSTADFGVGAFLLAACEYVRFLEKEQNADRKYWSDLAYKIAYPVLSNMAEGNLQKNMLVEVSPNWDGRNKKVTYMEAFGRLMVSIAPWLALPDDDTEEGNMRKQLREMALRLMPMLSIPIAPTISPGAARQGYGRCSLCCGKLHPCLRCPLGCRSTRRLSNATSRNSRDCAA